MCPNCVRGLTDKKEVCDVCGGTGIAPEVHETKKVVEKAEKEVKKGKK